MKVVYFLKSSMLNVYFVFYTVRNVDDARRVLEAEGLYRLYCVHLAYVVW